MRKIVAVYLLIVPMSLLPAVGLRGQTQRSTSVRYVDVAPRVSLPAEPDFPGTGLTVAAGPQANGASTGTIVPRLMKFSGALHDGTGKPLSGTVDVTFSLYSTEAGGEPLWFETQSVQADGLGHYTALLGAMHTDGLPIELFTSGEVRWLGIQVGLEAEQQPRVLLVSVPYALKAGDAETLGGKPASAYMLSDSQDGSPSTTGGTSATTTAQNGTTKKDEKTHKANTTPLACAPLGSDGLATANSIAMFTTACNVESSVISQSGGLVGIGTASPGAQLDVQNPTTQNNIALRATNANGTMMFIPNLGMGAYNDLVQAGDQGLIFYGTTPNAGNLFIGPWFGGGASGIRMTTTGKVGIGTGNPAAKLEVAGTAQFDSAVTIATGQVLAGALLDVQNPAAQNSIAIRATNANGTMMLIPNLGPGSYNNLVQAGDQGIIFYGTAPNAGNLVIGPWAGAGSPGIRMTAAGNVGIGTAAPAAKLEVNGTAQFDGAVSFAGTQSSLGAVTIAAPASSGSPAAALSVQATNVSNANYGVYSTSNGAGGTGVYGEADNGATAFGIWGRSTSGFAGHFDGPVQVVGNLTKSGGSFKIDHPLDPANKYLYHSFVESPDMKNIYDGVATLDTQCLVVVQLPAWFEALNRDFRYQLTCIGGYAPVYIADEVANNQFRIAGGKPGLKISWQVTGIRQDAWANAHRIPVEEAKPAQEQGYYLHPELFDAPEEKGVNWATHPGQMRASKQSEKKTSD